MIFFKNKKRDLQKFEILNRNISQSFQKVKQDNDLINQWLNYFNQKNQAQEQEIQILKNELKRVPKTPFEFKKILDEVYHFEALDSKISDITKRIDNLYTSQKTQPNQLSKINDRIDNLYNTQKVSQTQPQILPNQKILELNQRLEKIEAKKQSFKEKIIKKIAKNSKDYIKSMIVSYIKKYEKISAYQLKEMLVEEQKVCSKSSFYRILEEIESEYRNEISTIKQGKEKHYIGKLTRTQNI